MTRPTRIEINCETGVESVIELTDVEIAEMEAAKIKLEADRLATETAAQELAALKESAKAKLVAGAPLTEAEAATLVI